MKIKEFLLSLFIALFTGCGGDDGGGGTSNFGTKTEADVALASNKSNITLAYTNANSAASAAKSFSGVGKSMPYTYDKTTGFWTLDINTTSNNISYHYIYKTRFTPRDTAGKATASTNSMDYSIDYTYNGASGGYTYDWKYLFDMTTTGVSGYRANTGNLTLNGTWNYDLTSKTPYNGSTLDLVYNLDYTFTNVVYAPNQTYPLSGSITFKTKYSYNIPNAPQGYNVSGKITFDGDNTATVEFGGFTYTYNLQTGVIS